VIGIRRATAADADWLADLYAGEDVDPFLGPRAARDRDAVLEEIEQSERRPEAFGRFVIEADGERAGAFGFHQESERNAIARLEGLAVHPAFRGRRIAGEAASLAQRLLLVELGYHRIELACYAFNDRAIAHAERSGFVREGVKRKAYRRHGEWQDAVLFALLREDLDGS
jgi:RimJ/RimL family protein N-acetyltransferase